MRKQSYVEFTAEVVMEGKKQVCYLHQSFSPEVTRRDEWVPKSGARKPGFYKATGELRAVESSKISTKGKAFKEIMFVPAEFEFVSESKPTEAPAPAAAATPATVTTLRKTG